MIDAPVKPFDHTVVPAQPVAVNTTASPEHTAVLLLLIAGLFGLPTVTVISLDLLFPHSPP